MKRSDKNPKLYYFCFLYYISWIEKPFFTKATRLNSINSYSPRKTIRLKELASPIVSRGCNVAV